jgi:hypothetical protein
VAQSGAATADSLLLTIPNQLGVDYFAHGLDSVLSDIAPELGWREDHLAGQSSA